MGEEKEQLFRKESTERISSPDQLRDYMRVTSPSVWMVLTAVIVLLAGLLFCASARNVETTVHVRASAEGGTVTVVSEELTADGEQARSGMILRVAGEELPLEYVFRDGQGRMTATVEADLPDGEYEAVLVTESVRPISFLLN